MKTLFLLIILTQNGAGDINASFVNTETQQQCQQKASMLESVFRSSNIPVIENRCIESDLQFSAFSHASTASKIQNYYLVYFDANTVRVSPVPDWRTCIDQYKYREIAGHGVAMGAEVGRVYCGSSAQSLR